MTFFAFYRPVFSFHTEDFTHFVEEAFTDNDPEIMRINTPLNHIAGVKCSYVYILLKKTI